MKNFLKIVAGTFIGSLLAMTIGVFLLIGVISSIASFADKSTPKVPDSVVLSLNFNRPITDMASDDPFSGISPLDMKPKTSQNLYNFINTIDRAAEDPAVKFIYMNVTNLSAGISHIEEIRQALTRFRESGKAVIAYADNFSQTGYYLASAADKIYLNPGGMSSLTGLSINSIFFKDLLDRMGIEVQLIRHGKFKAAAEQFISNKMSPENREQLESYINVVWNSWMQDISASREISVEELNRLTDNLLTPTAQSVVDAKLVDGLMYKDEMVKHLTTLFGVTKEEDLKMISSSDYSRARVSPNLRERNKIAILYAQGDIVMGSSDKNIASDKFIEHISKLRKDSTIKAVVLRVNSPGGSAQSSEVIERELRLLMENKPLIVSMGDYAASGGYWISANANKILTNKATLTGSIGVFSMVPNFGKTMKKHLSLNSETVKTNRHSDIMSGYRPLNNTEIAFIQSAIEQIYTEFIELVSQGRNMTPEEVDNIAQGRVWSGIDATKIGLADEIGGIYDALKSAASLAEIESFRVVEYPAKKDPFEKLLEIFSQTSVNIEKMQDPFALIDYAYRQLREQSGVTHYARLPFNVSLNK